HTGAEASSTVELRGVVAYVSLGVGGRRRRGRSVRRDYLSPSPTVYLTVLFDDNDDTKEEEEDNNNSTDNTSSTTGNGDNAFSMCVMSPINWKGHVNSCSTVGTWYCLRPKVYAP
ncbi:hypothetical protein DQ04_21941000, partial [Trypanosoma grayi]|uniref:hypothetical protein n=1 Tax=Trypanosoma grayi TaxID=71804 RepID=UPI0004F4A790